MSRFTEDSFYFKSDSYKYGHAPQYEPGTKKVYSYFESRGGHFMGTIFFGLLPVMIQHLAGKVVIEDEFRDAYNFFNAHFGNPNVFQADRWQHIIDKHDGHLPLLIRAVDEGTYVPSRNVLMTVENTDPECFWLTNFVETMLSWVWYTSTIATNSGHCRNILMHFLHRNGTPGLIDYKLHDFGYRGVTCHEQAGLGGMAHLLSFKGTDTVAGIRFAQKFYEADVCGNSINATEHSTVTQWGRDRELNAYQNLLNIYPSGMFACVIDSYDAENAVANLWGDKLKDQVLARDGVVVLRPDSGDPVQIVCRLLDILWEKFHGTFVKGYKVLDPHVRLIQGDGIDSKMLWDILAAMEARGYSADNIAFGSGGGLLQRFDRDTARFAFKCSYSEIGIEGRDVYKDPRTDYSKQSKRGRLALVKRDGIFRTIREDELGPEEENLLKPVFMNGKILKRDKWSDIVARAKSRPDGNQSYV